MTHPASPNELIEILFIGELTIELSKKLLIMIGANATTLSKATTKKEPKSPSRSLTLCLLRLFMSRDR